MNNYLPVGYGKRSELYIRLALALTALSICASPTHAESGGSAPRDLLPAVQSELIAPVVVVSDRNRSVAFYELALGMEVLMSRDMGELHETMMAFPATPGRPGIMMLSGAAGYPLLKASGSARLILRVSNVDGVLTRMKVSGLQASSPVSVQRDVRIIHVKDPDGNDLELVERPDAAARPAR